MAVAYVSGSTAGNSTGGNLTITKPSGVVDGHILVVTAYNEISATAWTPPAGWVQYGSGRADYSGSSCWVNKYWKRASGEPANYTFNIASTWRILTMAAYSGVLASGDPLDGGPVGNSANTNGLVALSITNGQANSMNIIGMANYGGVGMGGYTGPYTRGPNLGGCEIFYQIQAASGASGNKTWDGPGASQKWISMHLSLKVAASGITGSVSQTLQNATLSAAGTVVGGITGTLSQTLQNATVVATGEVSGLPTIFGSVAQTLENASVSASGTVSGAISDHDIDVGYGYSDGTPRHFGRTSDDTVWIVTKRFDYYPWGDQVDGKQYPLRVYKSNQTGVPTSFPLMDSSHAPAAPQSFSMAVGANDVLHILWVERSSNGNASNLKYCQFDTVNGLYGSVTTIDSALGITNEEGQGDELCAIAVDESGAPHIVYSKSDGTRRRVNYRKFTGSWSSATIVDDQSFGGSQWVHHPGIVFDQNGRIVVSWVRGSSESNSDGRAFIRVYDGSWGTTHDITGSNVWPGIDTAVNIHIDPQNRYHLAILNSTKHITYWFSDNLGASWSSNSPEGGTLLGDNPTVGPYFGGKVRLYAHSPGTPTKINYYEGDGGSASWSSVQEYSQITPTDCSVGVANARYFNRTAEYIDIIYWVSNYPSNELYFGTDYLQGRHGVVTATLENASVVAAGTVESGAITGTLSATLENASGAVAGKVEVKGSLSQTLQDASLTSAGKLEIKAVLSATLENASLLSAGKTSIQGAASAILESVAASISGKIAVKGTTDTILENAIGASTGAVAILGAVEKTLESATLSGAGNVSVVGVLAKTLENVQLVSTGAVGAIPIVGVVSQTLQDATVSATGAVAILGSLAKTLEDASLSASGKTAIAGVLSATLANAVLSSAAKVAVSGLLNQTLENAALTSAGIIGEPPRIGTLDVVLANATGIVVGKVGVSGQVNATLENANVSASGVSSISGSVNVTLEAVASTTTGKVSVVGSVSVTLNGVGAIIAGYVGITYTPRERTLAIPRDPRMLMIEAERRSFLISDNRRYVVEPEDPQ